MRLALAFVWPGPPFFQHFLKSNHSFGTRLPVPGRPFQKLQIGMTAVSGAVLMAIFFFPKESDMCRLSAKWLVETEIAFSVEEQSFIGTTAGQIHFKSACGFSENFGTK